MKGMVTILLAAALMPVAAVAQEWQTYTYPNPGFSIQFPGVPAVETGTVKNATGVSLPMTRYVLRQAGIAYTLSVVNYSSTNDDALKTIFETQKSLGALGKVTKATGARINRNIGRALSIDGTDGSRSAIAIFFVDRHLYTVVGQALPPNVNVESGDASRFQSSLRFPDDSGGFGIFFFGGGGSSGTSSGTSSSSGGGGSSGTRPRVANNPPADAACAGKSAGDAVQLETPGGPVPATCTLVARPNSAAPAH
jgi:hypothetical protein